MAESTALHREVARGIRKSDLPEAWDAILLALEEGMKENNPTEGRLGI